MDHASSGGPDTFAWRGSSLRHHFIFKAFASKFMTLCLLASDLGELSPTSHKSRGKAWVKGLSDFPREVQRYSWIIYNWEPVCRWGCPLGASLHDCSVFWNLYHFFLQPCKFSTAYPKASSHDDDNDGYIPMGPVPALPCSKPQCNSDDYVPMNRGCIASPLPMLPANMEPPPVNRDLKPERKGKPFEQDYCAREGGDIKVEPHLAGFLCYCHETKFFLF